MMWIKVEVELELKYVNMNVKQEVQNAECRMQNAKCRMQNAECRMHNAKSMTMPDGVASNNWVDIMLKHYDHF